MAVHGNLQTSEGDFNEILHHHEKKGMAPRAQWQISDFCRCLEDCGFKDMGCIGDIFTWCNAREAPYTVRERLDRACCSSKWASLFPNAQVFHETMSSSDHSLIWIDQNRKPNQQLEAPRNAFNLRQSRLNHKNSISSLRKAGNRK
ncbi:UNVERIFIED_CONTAM: hypothetical protein Slati_2655500 [Sesamum latifolium]|uniref:Uncharacterized protein n=1 Tax=Sesamum latifolium TaxID=2727402 RepID=A0AAW2VUJ5_9LAMI